MAEVCEVLLAKEAMPPGVALRHEGPEDNPFLEGLFVSVRWSEFDGAGWPDEFRRQFLAEQFTLQSRHYAANYAGAELLIIERDESPIGRLYLFDGAEDIRVVDISLIPEVCGAGLGTLLLQAVQKRAAAAGKSASIHVEQNNPARRLYRRLGFAEQPGEGPYIYMEWRV
jgi:GNAT superfamily N-acetyltransferase